MLDGKTADRRSTVALRPDAFLVATGVLESDEATPERATWR